MKQVNVKKLILPNIPYVFIALLATKVSEAVRLAPGSDASTKLLNIMTGLNTAFHSLVPSFHPIDLCVGVAAAIAIRLAVYLSSVAAFSAGPRMCLYYASKEFVRSFSEAVAEEVRSTGVTVTALCPGPTATGFEQAAQMKNSHMFSMFKPASAAAVAEAGFRAAQKGKTLRYCGWPTHTVSIAARLLPRSVCRRFMMKVNG